MLQTPSTGQPKQGSIAAKSIFFSGYSDCIEFIEERGPITRVCAENNFDTHSGFVSVFSVDVSIAMAIQHEKPRSQWQVVECSNMFLTRQLRSSISRDCGNDSYDMKRPRCLAGTGVSRAVRTSDSNPSQDVFEGRLKRVAKRNSVDSDYRLDTKSSLALQLRHVSVAQWRSKAGNRHLWRETPVVTKKEIVKAISEQIGLTQLKTKEIVQKTFDAIVETLVSERRIELRNFGVFEVKKRAARKARNPRTGERVDVAEKYVVTFKPGKEMEEKVRQLEEAEAARKAASRQRESTSESAVSQVPPTATPPTQHTPIDSGKSAPPPLQSNEMSEQQKAYDPSYVSGPPE